MQNSCLLLINILKILLLENTLIGEPSKSHTAACKSNISCNCRMGPNTCPLNGICLHNSMVYKAEVNAENGTKAEYVGASASTFKERYGNHISSFNHDRYQNNTSLSKYVWDLKRKKMEFSVKWSIIGKAPPYNPASGTCKLCTLEKTIILFSDNESSLNQRSELMSKCRHRAKFLLCNIKI